MRRLGRGGGTADDHDAARRLADVERELARLSPQVAAVEQRLADLADRLDALDAAPDPGTPEDRVEARSVLEDVRREHAQVRARISAAVVYEERLRVLEERAGIDGPTGRPLG